MTFALRVFLYSASVFEIFRNQLNVSVCLQQSSRVRTRSGFGSGAVG